MVETKIANANLNTNHNPNPNKNHFGYERRTTIRRGTVHVRFVRIRIAGPFASTNAMAAVWQQVLALDARYNAYRTPNNPQFRKSGQFNCTR